MEKNQHDPHHHGGHHHGAHGNDDRHGARQPERFDPARAALLDDPSRFGYLPPDEIFEMLAAPAGGRVVDFGTGVGTYAIELARSRPDLEVIALDEQQEMLDLLRAKPAAQKLSNLKAVHTDETTKLNEPPIVPSRSMSCMSLAMTRYVLWLPCSSRPEPCS